MCPSRGCDNVSGPDFLSAEIESQFYGEPLDYSPYACLNLL